MTSNRSSNAILFIGCVDMISAGMLLPVVITIVPSLSSNLFFLNFLRAHPALITGVALSIYPLFQAIAVPLLGILADKYSRKKLLVLCLMGTLFANLFSVAAILNGNLLLFIASRAIDGLTGGNMTLLQSLLLEEKGLGSTEKTLGKLSGVAAIGFVFGPLLGGFCLHYSAQLPFIFMFSLNTLAVAVAFLLIVDKHSAQLESTPRSLNAALAELKKSALLKNIIALYNLIFFSLSTIIAYLGSYVVIEFRVSTVSLGLVFLLLGLSLGAAQMLLLPALSKRLAKGRIFLLSVYAVVSTMIMIAFAGSAWHSFSFHLVLLSIAIMGIGMLQNIAMGVIGSESQKSVHKTAILGLLTSSQTLSDFIARLSSGFFVLMLGNAGPFIVVAMALTACSFVWQRSVREQTVTL